MKAGQRSYFILILLLASARPVCAQTNVIELEMELGTNRCYVGEALPAYIKWIVNKPIGHFKAVDIRSPVMESELFKVYDSNKDSDKPTSTSLGVPVSGTRAIALLKTQKSSGRDRTELLIKKIIVPTAPGRHEIKPASMTCAISKTAAVSQKSKVTGSLYQYPLYFDNSFFDRDISPRDTRMSASSLPETIEILPLPSGKPYLFSGLTGRYSLDVSLSTNSLRRGDPLTVNISVSGDGYLAHVKFPPLEIQQGLTNSFRTASDRRLRKIDSNHVLFSQTVYPLKAGAQTFPSLTLSYFDPETGKYSESQSKAIPLDIEEAAVIDGSVFGLEEEPPKQDTHLLRWLLALAGSLLISGLIYKRCEQLRQYEKEDHVDLAAAHRQFRSTIEMLKSADFDSPRDQHDALNTALSTFLSAHMREYRPGAITYSDVDEMLEARNAPAKLRASTRELFRVMDMCRFSPGSPAVDYKDAITRAIDLIESL